MNKFNFLILNGPNLKSLGIREPGLYGTYNMEDFFKLGEKILKDIWDFIEFDLFQSNSEGEIIDKLEEAREIGVHGIILNAGAYTHTSLALADCLAWINIPTVEVHLTNILAREEIRQKSLISRHCIGVVSGFGIMSYVLGVLALWNFLKETYKE